MELLKMIHVFFRLFILCALSVIITMFTPEKNIYPQDNVSGAETDTCITSKCHAVMGKDAFVHMPVADGECMACHLRMPRELAHQQELIAYDVDRLDPLAIIDAV